MSDDILNSGLPADDAEKIADAAAKPVDLANDVDWRLRVASLEDEVKSLKGRVETLYEGLVAHAETLGALVNTGDDGVPLRLEQIEDSLRSLLHPSKWAEAGLSP